MSTEVASPAPSCVACASTPFLSRHTSSDAYAMPVHVGSDLRANIPPSRLGPLRPPPSSEFDRMQKIDVAMIRRIVLSPVQVKDTIYSDWTHQEATETGSSCLHRRFLSHWFELLYHIVTGTKAVVHHSCLPFIHLQILIEHEEKSLWGRL